MGLLTSLLPSLNAASGGLSQYSTSQSVADDAFIDLNSGVSGFGYVQAGDNEEFAPFTFTTAGVVTLLTDATANVVATDTDVKLCIFDNGTNVRIRNRLGSAKVLKIKVYYS